MISYLWIEEKYANMLSSRLDRFSKKGQHTYNFRCPYCGDSEKNRFKSRGYLYENKGHLRYKCHNCGTGKSFSMFLQDQDSNLHGDYRMEVLSESGGRPPERKERPVEKRKTDASPDVLSGLKRVTDLPANGPVREYIERRMIPERYIETMYYVPRFMEWVNTVIPGKFTEWSLKKDEPRLVIPFMDEDGNVFAVTGRSFKKSSLKYITVKFDEEMNKTFGLERVDTSKKVYIVEGPIDSFFLENSVAMAGSSGGIRFDDSVYVLDNEPRNKDIISRMEKLINAGETVCIWPDWVHDKDINNMVMSGMSESEIKALIDENSFSGLEARLRLSVFSKRRDEGGTNGTIRRADRAQA